MKKYKILNNIMKIIYKIHKINIENNFEKCYDVNGDNTLTI